MLTNSASNSRQDFELYFTGGTASQSAARPLVILIHGLTASPAEMLSLGKHLHSTLSVDVAIPCLSGHRSDLAELRRTHTKMWFEDLTRLSELVRTRKPSCVLIAGLSFGSLIATLLAYRLENEAGAEQRTSVAGLVILSPLIKLRAKEKELRLKLLSYLPESLLDSLGIRPKSVRAEGTFIEPRESFPFHSVGATARAWKLRSLVLQQIKRLKCPILLLQDPQDHHLHPNASAVLAARASSHVIKVENLPGAEHEMTIGPRQAAVFATITDFFRAALESQQISSRETGES